MARHEEELLDWADLANESWGSLLLGNGFSQNIWRRFGYTSLFEVAQSAEVDVPLQSSDVRLFDKLENANFETVLSALSIAIRVTEALDESAQDMAERRDSIRRALAAAVHRIHVPWANIGLDRLGDISQALEVFDWVFSTNYDLFPYWALVSSGSNFKDFFWKNDGSFELTDTEVWGKCTKLVHLHGAFHLRCGPTGRTYKLSSSDMSNLLGLVDLCRDDTTPLFISEGSPGEKMASIYRSEYLAFAIDRFSREQAPLVVFGHSLGESDGHIARAMNANPSRRVAMSVRCSQEELPERAAAVRKMLPRADISFFRSGSHPLGSTTLSVEDLDDD